MFPYTDNPLESSLLIKKQLYHNPISKPHDPFFSNFPSPFFDEHEQLPLNNILINTSSPKEKPDLPISNAHVAPPRRRNLGVAPRKRTGKKDRHSKIRTAQGVRDRRMRLSLQVARKFFDLQDMLGYDKASKTIEWLFCKSKKAIKELSKEGNSYIWLSDGKSESLVSECEVVSGSGIEENSNTRRNPKRKLGNARESRERARARARSRTREKMMIKELGQHHHQERVSAYDAPDYCPPPVVQDVGTIEKLLGNSTSAPPDNFMGFLGNWDLLNNDRFQLAVTNQESLPGNSTSIYSSPTTSDFPFFLQHD